MKRPYCKIDGVKHQLIFKNDVLRFPDDNRPMPDLNNMWMQYQSNKLKLSILFEYYINSGSSYGIVSQIFGHTGMNNHIVKNGNEKTKSFRIFLPTGKNKLW